MKTRTLTLLAALALVGASIAIPALAQPGPGGGPNHDRENRADREDREERGERGGPCSRENVTDNDTRAERCDRQRGGQDEPRGHERREFRQNCLDGNQTIDGNATADANATDDGNSTEDRRDRCDRIREANGHAHQARREAHALINAIAAHERRLERLQNLSLEIQAELAGNATGNQTVDGNATVEDGNETEDADGNRSREDRLEHRLAIVERHIERTEMRIAHLQAILDRLTQRWNEFSEARMDDDAGDDASDEADDDADEATEEASDEATDQASEDDAEDEEEPVAA